MRGIVVAGSLIQSYSDIGKYYLHYERGYFYIQRDKTFSTYKKAILRSQVCKLETLFSEKKYDGDGKMYDSYLVSIIFYDKTNMLLECDAEALKKLIIRLY